MLAYKDKANFEAKEMHDWNSTKLYSEKALSAIKGKEIYPEKINYWKIINTKDKYQLNQAYESLMSVYKEGRNLDPFNLAKAISSLDCWAEQQEENWQTWDINKCKDDFLTSIHKIYNKINAKNIESNIKLKSEKIVNESNDKTDSVSVVTEDHKKNILQIIYFDFDKAKLTNISINEIKSFIKVHKKEIKKYIISGHTDTVGSKKYNKDLSLERAQAVEKILIDLGIDKENISLLAKGEESLKVPTNDNVRHPVNRRAEIRPLN